MTQQAFLQVAIPVLYVYDPDVRPEAPPGFDLGMLPVVSRVLKDHAGTSKVTVVTGAPTPAHALDKAFTHLALQYATLKKASPEAGNLLAAEFIADNFDGDAVLEHLARILKERQREVAEQVESLSGARRTTIEDVRDADLAPPDSEDAGEGEPGPKSS